MTIKIRCPVDHPSGGKQTPYSRKDFTKERKKSVTSKNHQGRVEITNEVFKEMTYFKNVDIFTLKT